MVNVRPDVVPVVRPGLESDGQSSVSWGAISVRTAWIFLTACLLFEAASILAFLAATNFAPADLNDPIRLLHTGARGANLVRGASLLDMLGYLSAVPVAVYLRQRFREGSGMDLFTLAGVLFMVLGALGAVIFAFAGAPLIREYAASSSGRHAVEATFTALHRIVFFGIWQTLDAMLAGVWAFGVGWHAWRQHARPLAAVLFALGAIGDGFAAAHIFRV
jgi:hypothetical protein